MTLPVSIVIPTYNRAQLLARVLPTYLSQGCSEVIIVDDHSSLPVESLLKQFDRAWLGNCEVQIIRNAQRLQSPASRMVGACRAREPFLFFGEDDAYLSAGHIRVLYDFIIGRGADAVASSLHTTSSLDTSERELAVDLHESSSVSDFVSLNHYTIETDVRPSKPISLPWLHALALLRKDLVLEYGFDTNYRGNAFREETDFFLRVSHQGQKLLIVPAPPAFHYKGPLNLGGGQHRERPTLGAFLWYEYWVARNNYYFLKKNASILQSLGERPNPLFGTTLYMMRRTLGYPGRFIFQFSGSKARRTRLRREHHPELRSLVEQHYESCEKTDALTKSLMN